tara:strand:+ start:546 stop:977 length:432 start_codon:yes stop_codon:yes gene_type:complete
MEIWIPYALVAAFLIACRDVFTKQYSRKYNLTEHLLYYYILCGFFVVAFALYQYYYNGEKIRCIESGDVWKYAIIAMISVIIIGPCQTYSLKMCRNPGQSNAVINLNTLFAFLLGLLLFKDSKVGMKTGLGILMTAVGIYLIF